MDDDTSQLIEQLVASLHDRIDAVVADSQAELLQALLKRLCDQPIDGGSASDVQNR